MAASILERPWRTTEAVRSTRVAKAGTMRPSMVLINAPAGVSFNAAMSSAGPSTSRSHSPRTDRPSLSDLTVWMCLPPASRTRTPRPACSTARSGVS